MSTFLLYSVAAVVLLGLGTHGLLTRRHLLRQVMALNVIAGGSFLLLISTSYRNQDALAGPDPVPHAMVLTGIVVAISATGFALALVRRIHQREDEADANSSPPHEDPP